ncbi:hypothetical protein [Paenibacillus sedimenti]|uniref:Uncharacterized protein n=1 Tax=Paenibacillus sedimenti TaxID=2770274 RepID=A0A926KU89_9BACL|nr:hypothetical protein [Paenibacillus sedimenti]MBD0384135.1 hypothetical protein [Paenibacillus sedimenti]
MKPTLELQDIIAALGIDANRYQAWQQKELQAAKESMIKDETIESTLLYELVV